VNNVEWVPIVMFMGLTVVFGLLLWFRYRGRSDVQTTIRAALDKGQELSPELIERLGHPKPPPNKDLRLGVIWIAVAIGLIAFGFGIPDEDEVHRIFTGIAAFPGVIGIAYLILHKITGRD